MVSIYKEECWMLTPDDRAVNFYDVHYFVGANEQGLDSWLCLLCDAGPMLMNRVRHHRNGSRHSRRCEQLKQARSAFDARIDKLGKEEWKWHVADETMPPVSKNSSVADRRAHYFRFVQAIERYEQMERLSLLELAIWKANCTANGAVFSNMQEIYDYWALESSFDPLVYLQQKRITSGVTVIIENVLPFL